MTSTLIINARVLTMVPRLGDPLGVIPRGEVLIDPPMIAHVGPVGSTPVASRAAARVIDAQGRVLMPGFIDAHTHALWAGDRIDEWELKRRGVSYLDILKGGGGIMSTVRAVRAASEEQLAEALAARLRRMLREGTTTVEVKSGYGLSTVHELKMLRAIRRVQIHAQSNPGDLPDIIPTALIAHALDPDVPVERFVEHTISETLPAVSSEFPGVAIDAYCEQGAWPLDACVRLFTAARELGHPFRVHTDQFNCLGMTRWAIEHGARSVDHLEATDDATLEAIARSRTFAVMLPCTGFHTDGRYARGRPVLEHGGKLVLATNCNPGSSPCCSVPMALAFAVRFLGVGPEESLLCVTRHPAEMLGCEGSGAVSQGVRADLNILHVHDERLLAHDFGGNPVSDTWKGGNRVHPGGV